jgi:hypothetical protein
VRVVVETGTDVAAVAVGDPSLLGPLQECRGSGYERLRDEVAARGELWRADTGADGAYRFHIFVDEEPPATVAQFLEDPQTVEPFRVPSGRLLVAGEEFFVGALSIGKYPHMGQEIQVPPGDYSFTAFRVEGPEEYVEDRFVAAATPDERRAWEVGNALPVWGCLGSVAALAVAALAYARTGSILAAALPVLAAVAAWVGQARYRRRPEYVAAEARYRSIEREMPSIVLVLRTWTSG